MFKKAKVESSDESIKDNYCQSCLSKLRDNIKEFCVEDTVYKYQCEECLFIGKDIINLYNKVNDECLICFEKVKSIDVFECGHSVCTDCFKGLKKFNNNNNKNKIACTYCRNESDKGDIKRCFKKNINIKCPAHLKDSMFNLYRRFFENKTKEIDKTGRERDKIIITLHHNTIYCFFHYFKWLRIVANNKQGAINLSPGKFIDDIWHIHILDTVDYRNFCETFCGKFIDHYPQNGYISNIGNQHRNRVRLLKKLREAKIDEKMVKDAWGFVFSESTKSEKYDKQIFLKLLNGTTETFKWDLTTTCQDVQNYLKTKYDYPKCNLIYSGKIIPDDNILSEFGIKNESTIIITVPMRGC